MSEELQKKLDEAVSLNVELLKERDGLKDDNNSLSESHVKTISELEMANTKIVGLEAKVETLNQQNERLKSKLSEAEHQREEFKDSFFIQMRKREEDRQRWLKIWERIKKGEPFPPEVAPEPINGPK